MKITALYKTFSGSEFLHASVNSIYDYVDQIVFVHSRKSWTGQEGNDVVDSAATLFDLDDKIHELIGDFPNQETQYDIGLKFIQKHFPSDYILLIDTDEVWDAVNFKKALDYLRMLDGRYKAFSCHMRTYIKSTRYMIDPPEPCTPTVFIRGDVAHIHGVRGSGMTPRADMKSVYFHHFTYVRNTEEAVFQKIKTSHAGDRLDHHPLDEWKKNVWDKIPFVKNFHPSVGFEKCWQGIKVLDDCEIPVDVKYTTLQEGEL